MKLEHKIGIAITCTFLCLTGAVIGLKMQEHTLPPAPSVADAGSEKTPLPDPPDGKKKRDAKNPDPFEGFGNPDPPRVPQPPAKAPTKKTSASTASSSPPPPATFDFRPKPSQNHNSPAPVATLVNPEPKPNTKSATAKNPKESETIRLTGETSLQDLDNMLSSPGGPSTPVPAVEQNPTLTRVMGINQWEKYSRPPGSSPPSTTPATTAKGVNAAPPPLLPVPDAKKNNQTKVSAPSVILAVGGMESPNNPVSAPAQPGKATPPPAAPPQKPSGSGPPPAPAFPAYLSNDPAPSPKLADPKAPTPPPSLPAPAKPPELPNLAPPPSSPSPPPALPAPQPPTTTPIPPPSSMPVSPPSTVPAPVAAPVVPLPTPIPQPTPPKSPPPDGSYFLPNKSPTAPNAASGAASNVPAPFPSPAPPSAPLDSGTDKSAASAATLTRPQPMSQQPSVTVYDELEYTSRPGDTWESISKDKYQGTDRYARALQRHNQNHPRASDQLARTGQLAAGARIFIPQAHILEERYADLITRPVPVTSPAMMRTGFDPAGSPPRNNP